MFSGESVASLFVHLQKMGNLGVLGSIPSEQSKEIPIQPGQVITVDTGHVVAFDDTVTYEIGKVGGMKSLFLGGEGLVMHFSSQGSVWIQTRNVSLASKLIPFLPSRGN